jgi:hypothetical protein
MAGIGAGDALAEMALDPVSYMHNAFGWAAHRGEAAEENRWPLTRQR